MRCATQLGRSISSQQSMYIMFRRFQGRRCCSAQEGTWVISLGTSGTLFGVSQKPVVDPEGGIAPFCDAAGSFMPLLCTMNCTVVAEEVGPLTPELSICWILLVIALLSDGCMLADLHWLWCLPAQRLQSMPAGVSGRSKARLRADLHGSLRQCGTLHALHGVLTTSMVGTAVGIKKCESADMHTIACSRVHWDPVENASSGALPK